MTYLFYYKNDNGTSKYALVSVKGYVDGDIFVVTDNCGMYDENDKPLTHIVISKEQKEGEQHVFTDEEEAENFIKKTFGEYEAHRYSKNLLDHLDY